MTQAGALTVHTGFDLDVDPLPPADDEPRRSTPLRLTIPLLLAAGWGALLTFSVMFLIEDGRSPAAGTPERVAASGSVRADAKASSDAKAASEETAPVEPRPAAAPASEPDPSTPGNAIRQVATAGDAAASAAPAPPTASAERPDYVGIWGPTAEACTHGHRRGYLPAMITEDVARAGRTHCRFRNGHRDGIAWAMAADCSERGRRWTSQVRLLVDGNHLTWTSAKGAATYVRCSRRDG